MKINKIYLGDCLEVLKTFPDNWIDSIVTDPPYELGFMGKSWDNTGIANNKEMWAECLRVLKPGGHLLAFSGTRTYHRTACAIEDAGFEVRDMIEWVYGSGFPKSLNIGKVMDKFLKTGNASWNGTGDSTNGALGYSKLQNDQGYRPADYSNRHQNTSEITENKAKEWEGWGTALKPAHEPICMARKPLSEKTIAENCLKWGTGGINIDESRVDGKLEGDPNRFSKTDGGWGVVKFHEAPVVRNEGRFPANLIHDNSEEVRECFPEAGKGNGKGAYNYAGREYDNKDTSMFNGDKPQAPSNFNDSGNASRFFKSIIYQAKASKSERNKGCDGLEEKQYSHDGRDKEIENPYQRNKSVATNNHPTVKPIALMEYLIKMVTSKGGVVLDPFAGSGSTLIACKINGFKYVGIELNQEYIDIAEARLKTYQPKLLN